MPRLLPLIAVLLLATAGCGGSDRDAATDATRAADTVAESDSPAAGNGAAAFQREGTVSFLRDADTLATIDVEIAETDAERQRGLMERLALPAGSGMIFLMERNEPQSFWMKNTPMALDIFFANADSQIVRVAKNTRPNTRDRVRSEAPAKFVIEVPAGYADRRGIFAGDRIHFRRLGDGAGAREAEAAFDARPRSEQP